MMRAARWTALALLALAVVALLFWWALSSKAPEPQPAAPAVAHAVIGSSTEGRPIRAYTYGSGPRHVLFVGGMHGGYEWNSVLLAYRFMDYFSSQPDAVPAEVSVTIVPSANPDGLYKVVGTEGRFAAEDISASPAELAAARFNANGVDLNRNFDCKWEPTATWRSAEVSAGSAAFSEPEARAVRDIALALRPAAAVFWHSQANAVYASECEDGILPATLAAMDAYAQAAGYRAVDKFDAYPVVGDAEGWLASVGIPAITVELSSHENVDWEKNVAGVAALLALTR